LQPASPFFLSAEAGEVMGLRESALRKIFPVLPPRLKLISLAAVAATASFVLGASGQVGSAVATEEPAEPLSPYARTGFAFGVGPRGVVLVGFVNARGSSTTARFQTGRTRRTDSGIRRNLNTIILGTTPRNSKRRRCVCGLGLSITSGSLRRTRAVRPTARIKRSGRCLASWSSHAV
jgi:hypothetical protein